MEQQEARSILKGCGCLISALTLIFISWCLISINFDKIGQFLGMVIEGMIEGGRFILLALIIIILVIPILAFIIFMIKVILVACGIKK